MDTSDEFWMRMAIDAARNAKTPYGAVLIDQDFNYVTAFNSTKLHGPTAHAEMNVLQRIKELDHNSTDDLILFSTVEPCPMCMSAIIWSKISSLVFGSSISTAADFGYQIPLSAREIARIAERQIEIRSAVLEKQCNQLLKDF